MIFTWYLICVIVGLSIGYLLSNKIIPLIKNHVPNAANSNKFAVPIYYVATGSVTLGGIILVFKLLSIFGHWLLK
jgi:hypothetical protein